MALATEQIELMTYVTCQTMRYHPAVFAQKAATVQLLSGGRDAGSGRRRAPERARGRCPMAAGRHEMLEDAFEIIRPLLDGET